MKKAIALALASIMAVSLVACGGAASSAPAASTAASSAPAPAENVTLKISTWDLEANPSVTNVVKQFEAANPN
ncbi:MAG: sugar ABC transporter substrate-binding protein, partial [Ruthenibacterium sp.]